MDSQSSIAQLWLASKKAEHQSLQMLFDLSQLVGQLHNMIHFLQLERGSSVLYLASDGEIPGKIDYREFRQAFCQSRESFNQLLAAWLKSAEGSNLGGGVYINLAKALSVMQNDLYQTRRDIDSRSISSIQAAKVISATIKVLINVVVDMTELSQEPKIANLMISLIYIMKAKEFAGQERALGVYLAASGLVNDTELENQRLSLIEMQQYYLGNFAEIAPSDIQADLTKINESEAMQNSRKQFEAKKYVGLGSAQTWFDICTQRIEKLHKLEAQAVQTLQLMCAKRLGQSDELLSQDQQWIEDFVDKTFSSPQPDSAGSSTSIFMQKLTEQGQALKLTQQELAKTKQTLLDQRVIQLAKSKLMKRFKLSEEAAHRKMQQVAMSKGLKLAELANEILSKAQ